MRIAVITISLCLAACIHSDRTDEMRQHSGSDRVTDPFTGSVSEQVPAREPTPCLDERNGDLYPVRRLEPDAGTEPDGADEPSVGLVIFDRSGSMSGFWLQEGEEEPDPTDPGTKWDAASEALIGAVTPVQHRTTLGAIFFPQPEECLVAPFDHPRHVPFLEGPEFLATWQEVAPLNGPNGATPLQAAFIVAERAIEEACVEGLLDGRFFVMVLTDGMPNCDVDMGVVTSITSKWLEHGVATYVFGLPGSEGASSVLDQIAAAGGTETLIVPGSPSDLEGGMAACM